MSWFDGMRSAWRNVARHEQEERELREDIEFHLSMEAEKLERQGLDRDEARRIARVRFGGVDRMMERTRDETGVRWYHDLSADLRYGWRALRSNPLFAATAVLTLTVGIGATAAAYTVVDGVLLRPLPFEDAGRLVELRELGEGRRFFPSYPNFSDWRESARSFEGMTAIQPFGGPVPVLGMGEPAMHPAMAVGRDFLEVLGVAPHRGRDFTAEENALGGPNVVMISHRLWSGRFAAEPDLSAVSLTLSGERYQVVGVLPPGFRFLHDADVYYAAERWPGTVRNAHSYRVIARLGAGVSMDRAREEMDGIAAAIRESFPESQAERVQVRPLEDVILGTYRRPLSLLLVASALVLLLACANVMSTLLARGSARTSEILVRTSLGAGRGRIVRQLLTESLLLGGLGALLGSVLAWVTIRGAAGFGSEVLPRLGDVHLGWRTLVVIVGTALFCALAAGTYPARRLANGSGIDGGLRGASARQGRVWSLLIGTEGAAAVVLLAGAGLLVWSLLTIVREDRGWDPSDVVAMSVTLPGGVLTPDEATDVVRRLKTELETLPGVSAVGLGTHSPLDAGAMTAPAREAGTEPRMDNYTGWRLVDEDYFAALEIELVRGRSLTAQDTDGGLVNRSLARFLWGEEDPIGKRVVSNYGGAERPIEVVGVVEDAMDWRFSEGSQTEIYVPWWAWQDHVRGPVHFFIRTAGDPQAIIPAARDRLRTLHGQVPAEFELLSSALGATVADRRFVVWVLLAFAGAGALLAVIGVFGVVAYTVARRRREIGIRVALGATGHQVRRDVRRPVLLAVSAGSLVGILVVVLGGGLIEGLLYEVPARSPLFLSAVAILFLATAWLASEVPARGAMRFEAASILKD